MDRRSTKTDQTYWILERVEHPRFPYRLTIVKGSKTLLALRVGHRWPGSKGNIFCLRDEDREWPPPIEELERVPVISMRRYGKRLSIVLDRARRKRCDFLFLTKPYKQKPGEYEQIFWQTQHGLRQRRPRARFTIYGQPELTITIDSNERYPWSFPGSTVEREPLPAGDYALQLHGEVAVVVERKTFENLLRDLSDLRVLHQQLGELEAYPLAALVIEANYSDFLSPEKNKPLGSAYCARALAEVAVLHPRLRVHFAGNRKLANEWVRVLFWAAAGHSEDRPPPLLQEATTRYGRPPTAKGGTSARVRKAIREDFPPEFAFRALRERFPDLSKSRLRSVITEMRKSGELERRGRGRASRWIKR